MRVSGVRFTTVMKPQVESRCHVCGDAYAVVTGWQKHCSAKCNSIASNTRRRADPSCKQCRSCRENLPIGHFEPAHRSCKPCEALKADGLKRCTKCRAVKAHDDFHRRPGRSDGRDSRCRTCRSEDSRARNAQPERKRIARDNKLRLKYGIGAEEVDAMLRRQGGRCGICGSTKDLDQLHVDHDHSSGRVRELLCLQCNALLGHAKESVDVLRAAILYLERHTDAKDMGP